MIRGRVRGTWKKTFRKKSVRLEVQPFGPIAPAETSGIQAAAERFGAFYGLEAEVAYKES